MRRQEWVQEFVEERVLSVQTKVLGGLSSTQYIKEFYDINRGNLWYQWYPMMWGGGKDIYAENC